MNIGEFRQQYPQYDGLPDDVLASRLYQKHYADKLTPEDFGARFGVPPIATQPAAPVPIPVPRETLAPAQPMVPAELFPAGDEQQSDPQLGDLMTSLTSLMQQAPADRPMGYTGRGGTNAAKAAHEKSVRESLSPEMLAIPGQVLANQGRAGMSALPEPTVFRQFMDNLIGNPDTVPPGGDPDVALYLAGRAAGLDLTGDGQRYDAPTTAKLAREQIGPEIGVAERGGKDFAAGAIQTGGGLLGYAARATGSNALREGQQRITQKAANLMPSDPNFMDNLAAGAGSTATFFIPGMGIAKGAQAVANVSRPMGLWLGSGSAAGMEAAVEAGAVYEQAMAEGKSERDAAAAADKTFFQNAALLALTNRFGLFGETGSKAMRRTLAAAMEGGQEGVQQVISNTALDKPAGEGVGESTAIGALIGAGASGNVSTPQERLGDNFLKSIDQAQVDPQQVDQQARDSLNPEQAQYQVQPVPDPAPVTTAKAQPAPAPPQWTAPGSVSTGQIPGNVDVAMPVPDQQQAEPPPVTPSPEESSAATVKSDSRPKIELTQQPEPADAVTAQATAKQPRVPPINQPDKEPIAKDGPMPSQIVANAASDLSYNLPKNTIAGGAEHIAKVVQHAKGHSNTNKRVRFAVIDQQEAERLAADTGLDLAGYRHTVDTYGIRHAIKSHGDAAKEDARAQIPVTEEDFQRIPQIVADPDEVKLVGQDSTGNELIQYRKAFNGTTYYVEEVRDGRQELVTKTLWKTRTPLRATSVEGVADTSETMGRNPPELAESITPDAEKIKSDSSSVIEPADAQPVDGQPPGQIKQQPAAQEENDPVIARARANGREAPFGDVKTLMREAKTGEQYRDGDHIDDVAQAVHDGQYDGVKRYAETQLPAPVREDDIPVDLANRAFYNTSHTPEKRGQVQRREYVQRMAQAWREVEPAIKDEEAKARVTESFQQFRDGYAAKLRAYLEAHSRVASTFITGPAKFPVAANEKRGRTADKRLEEVEQFYQRGVKRLKKLAAGPVDNSTASQLEQARQKLEQRETAHEQMKAANKVLRSKKLSDSEKRAQLREVGLTEKQIDALQKQDYAGRTGFKPFELQNNNAEIRRLRQRVDTLETQSTAAKQTGGSESVSFDGGEVELDHAAGVLRIRHDEKPSKETIQALKAKGFRWAPSKLAWQRKLTESAKYDARKITRAALSRSKDEQPSNTSPGPGTLSSGFDPVEGIKASRELYRQAAQYAEDHFTGPGSVTLWQKSVGTMRSIAKKNPHFAKVYNLAEDYMGDTSTYAMRSEQLAPDFFRRMDNFKEAVTTGNAREADLAVVAEAVFAGTIDEQTVFSDEVLSEQFNMSAKQIGLYRQAMAAAHNSLSDLTKTVMVRMARKVGMPRDLAESALGYGNETVFEVQEALDEILAEVQQELEDNLALAEKTEGAERKAMEWQNKIDLIKGARKDLVATANKAEKLKRQGYFPLTRFGKYTVDVVDEEGERVYFGMFESKAEANRMARMMAQAYDGAKITTGIMNDELFKLYEGMTPETVELFARHLGVQEETAMQEYLKEAVNNRSALKRLIRRKGVPGFSQDLRRVLATFVLSNANASSKNLHMGDMLEAVQDIPREQGDVQKQAQRLTDYLRTPREEFSAIRSYMFFHFLGGSISSALTNMTQVPMVTVPYLTQFDVTAAARVAKWMSAREPVDLAHKSALKRAREEGVVSPQEVYNLMATARGGRLGGGKVLQSQPMQTALYVWGSMFSAAEQWNRLVTFNAAYEIARAKGASNPYAFAKEAVEETQFVYARHNRPNWARGLGAPLFTFKQFLVNYIEFIGRLPAKQKLLAMALLVAAAGLEGLPFEEDLEDIIDAIGQWMGYPTNSRRTLEKWAHEYLGATFGDMLLKGVSGIPGMPIDVQARLSLGNLIPGTGALKPSSIDKGRDTAELVGPAGSLVQNVARASEKLAQGKVGEAARTLAPRAVANLIQGIDMIATGEYRDSQGRKVTDATIGEGLWKMAGLHPNKVAKIQDAKWSLMEDRNLHRLKEDAIADKWAQGLFEQNQAMVIEAQKDRDKWNKANPELLIVISKQQIKRRLQDKRLTAKDRFMRTMPKEIRGQALRYFEESE